MAESIGSRIKNAWNAFLGIDNETYMRKDLGYQSSISPMRKYYARGNERSIITAILNKISLDVSAYNISHVRLDDNKRYKETIDSPLQECLTVEANKDQTGRAFIQDATWSMLDEGVVALVPVVTSVSPLNTGSYEIYSLRTGKILSWFPDYVRVEVYNDMKGIREELTLPKSFVAIVENPFYSIMNEPNGTLQRLIRKLTLLDVIDEQSGSGKLDIIIQLPYVIKTEARRAQAEERRRDIERQLSGSKYGIAYTDGTERITQLNRPSENNLLEQITYLTNMLYSQLGISESVFDGSATQGVLLNYFNRTIEPIATAIIEELSRKFLTKTARTQGQSIMGFKDVLRLVPANELADMADVFSRNEIMTANEMRSIIGLKPSSAPQADELRNKNMPIEQQPKYNSKTKEVNEEVPIVEEQ